MSHNISKCPKNLIVNCCRFIENYCKYLYNCGIKTTKVRHLKIEKYTEEIALEIISGETYTKIVQKYNLATKTIYRLRQSSEFQSLLMAQKKKCFEAALNQASYLSTIAVKELKRIILDEETSAQNKIQACKTILELAKNNYEYENVEQRIESLEKMIKGGLA